MTRIEENNPKICQRLVDFNVLKKIKNRNNVNSMKYSWWRQYNKIVNSNIK